MRASYGSYQDVFVELYKAGYTSRQISEMYGCTHKTVLNWLHKANVKLLKGVHKFDKYHLEWVQLYKQGMSIAKIAEKYGCSYTTVYEALKKYGITFEVSRRYYINEEYFDVLDTDAKNYILGFIAADGHVNEKRGFF